VAYLVKACSVCTWMVICTALFQHGTLFPASDSRVCLDELKVKTDED